MKKAFLITGIMTTIVMMSCGDKVRRDPGKAYMPDMAYSRAYETNASHDNLEEKGIHYDALPVNGTVARGDMPAYALKNDEAGYAASASIKNPLAALSKEDITEAERLYLVNCGICHGKKLDGNGPLWNNGDGPYPAAPKNLLADDMKAMAEGTMFHSVTYGKGQMGSYASQMSTKQRWMVIHYIKSMQSGNAVTASTDSTAVVK